MKSKLIATITYKYDLYTEVLNAIRLLNLTQLSSGIQSCLWCGFEYDYMDLHVSDIRKIRELAEGLKGVATIKITITK